MGKPLFKNQLQQKGQEDMAQAKHLPSKEETPSSNPSTERKKKKT
jgi:hypothetical protein